MATHKSAVKRARQNEVRRLRNKVFRTQTKTAVSRTRTAIENGSVEEAREMLAHATTSLQKAASKGIVHKNTASRKISRLSKQIQRLSQTST